MRKEIQTRFKLQYNIDPKKSGFYKQILRIPELIESYNFNGEFAYVDKATIEEYGWKIHISSSLLDIENVIEKTFDVLIKHNSSFKILKSIDLYVYTSSKHFSRSSYGKLITVYPSNYSQFRRILDDLYIKLKKYSGPYILSDRRYKDSKCIYYRYGTNISNYFDNDGSILRKYYNNGNEYIDTINPFFELPDFINDEINFEIENSKIFSKKLEVLRAIQFSNAGGTYVAMYKPKKIKTVVKEARGYTSLDCIVDSIKYREHEKKLLIKLKSKSYIPNYIDDFETFDNYYLITEFIEGDTLTKYVQKNNPIYMNNNLSKNDKYIISIFKLLKNIILKIQELNNLDIYLFDLSPDNMILNFENIYFIDLEGAYDSEHFRHLDKVYSNHKIDLNIDKTHSQIYSIMMLLIYCIYDKTIMFINKEEVDIDKIFLPIRNKTNFYKEIVYLINLMHKGKINLQEILEYIELNITDEIIDSPFEYIEPEITGKNLNLSIDCSEENISNKKSKSSVEYYEKESVKKIFNLLQTNLEKIYKLQELKNKYEDYSYVNKGIKSGYPGIAYTLREIQGFNILDKIDDVILSMFSGYLGNVWLNKNVDIMKIENNSNFNEQDSSLIHGLSGIGISLIKLYLKNKDPNILTIIERIANNLIENRFTFTKNGLFYGSSGIALFLLYMYKLTSVEKYLLEGEKVLEYDINNLFKDKFGCILLRQGQDDVSSPYLMNGSVGVASVLLRYYLYTNKIKYKYITIDIMNSLENSLSLHTGLFEGMSGIANVFLDCYFIIGDDLYLNIANRIALDISNSLYNNDGFVSGYSRDGKNLSFTFDYGSSGVVMFLNRLLKNNKYNFIPYLDKEMEEISEQNIKKSNQ